MGMDVFGKQPKNKKGEYFRNNVWWWRPLWEFCEFVAPELTDKVEYGYSNDGDGLDADDARKLGNALRKAFRNGVAEEYKNKRQAWLDGLPIRPCIHCQATGKRTWYHSPDRTQVKASLEYSIMELVVGEQSMPHYTAVELPKGWTAEEKECNACAGTGGEESWAKNYAFDENNVRAFATFLVNCGGFEIW